MVERIQDDGHQPLGGVPQIEMLQGLAGELAGELQHQVGVALREDPRYRVEVVCHQVGGEAVLPDGVFEEQIGRVHIAAVPSAADAFLAVL